AAEARLSHSGTFVQPLDQQTPTRLGSSRGWWVGRVGQCAGITPGDTAGRGTRTARRRDLALNGRRSHPLSVDDEAEYERVRRRTVRFGVAAVVLGLLVVAGATILLVVLYAYGLSHTH